MAPADVITGCHVPVFAVLDPALPVVPFRVNVFAPVTVILKVVLTLKLPLPAFANPVTPEIETLSLPLKPPGKLPVVVT